MLDMELIAHLDFEPEKSVPCEGYRFVKPWQSDEDFPECINPATINAIRACCGKVDELCQECYDKHMADKPDTYEIVVCKKCDAPRPIPPYVLMEPKS